MTSNARTSRTRRLLELQRQVIEIVEWGDEGSELEFLVMAERARARGREPERLLRSLIRKELLADWFSSFRSPQQHPGE